ncbi:H-type small acid-soluble spore protein [Aquibacillus koreensis]|uniref:Small, acid-soluble spore protein H n=1 Tax=Aquibacillus koreensis TaxID=279446 RepID=A0A9X3WKM4_9BACI|nr:H-type small acid-soluble spore protein [Aquibacillus koreensis]MCT2535679.1 H-type small acid-soluble spore protein [Aquibacillus koreensis]MDC3420036.1 H-type small acid-soluble spore protein [Aquibacillus koreensis]
MDAQRAQEIASSPVMANVSFNGAKVYIEHVDQEVGKATVHTLHQPENKQSVSVDHLTEQ